MNGLSHGIRYTLAHCNLSRTVAWEVLWVRIFFAANRALRSSLSAVITLSSLSILRQVRRRRHRAGDVSTRVGQLLHGSAVIGGEGMVVAEIGTPNRPLWIRNPRCRDEQPPDESTQCPQDDRIVRSCLQLRKAFPLRYAAQVPDLRS